MKMLARAAFVLLVLPACAPAVAQSIVANTPPSVGSSAIGYGTPGSTYQAVDAQHGMPMNCISGCSSSSGSSTAKSGSLYTATASGTGYSSGDLLDHVVTSNPASMPNAGAVTASYWIDLNSGTLLASAPASGNVTLVPTTVANTDFGADCIVVSGDQAYTVGATQRCTMTANGRVKVGLSSAASAGAVAATYSDLTGFVDPSGNQQAGKVDANGAIKVATPIPTTDGAVQLALVANTRAQLGSQITATNGVVCKASPNNTADVLIGGSAVTVAEDGSGTGWPLAPGESWASAISSTSSIYFITTGTSHVVFCHGN